MTITASTTDPVPAPPRPRLRRVAYEPDPGTARAGPAQPPTPRPPRPPDPMRPATATREYAQAHRTVARIIHLALEVLDGRRPSGQLAGHFAPAPMRYWRAALAGRQPRSRARFERLRMCLPRSGAAEVAVTCTIDGRIRALAARFEQTGAGWRCTAIRLG